MLVLRQKKDKTPFDTFATGSKPKTEYKICILKVNEQEGRNLKENVQSYAYKTIDEKVR